MKRLMAVPPSSAKHSSVTTEVSVRIAGSHKALAIQSRCRSQSDRRDRTGPFLTSMRLPEPRWIAPRLICLSHAWRCLARKIAVVYRWPLQPGAVHLADGLVMDFEIECPKHSGAFDYRTGEAIRLPPCVNLQTYLTEIDMVKSESPSPDFFAGRSGASNARHPANRHSRRGRRVDASPDAGVRPPPPSATLPGTLEYLPVVRYPFSQGVGHENTNAGPWGCRSVLHWRDGGGDNKSQAVRPGRAARRRGGDGQGAAAAGRPGPVCARRRAISRSVTARRSWAARTRPSPTRISGPPRTPRR